MSEDLENDVILIPTHKFYLTYSSITGDLAVSEHDKCVFGPLAFTLATSDTKESLVQQLLMLQKYPRDHVATYYQLPQPLNETKFIRKEEIKTPKERVKKFEFKPLDSPLGMVDEIVFPEDPTKSINAEGNTRISYPPEQDPSDFFTEEETESAEDFSQF